ncbi:MAG: dihydrodipicolinate synthase family protein [Betaproteobacteria bacterium]|nr:dihydrodipicolinate synthase family protein [Betaproteobacteria bacterium]
MSIARDLDLTLPATVVPPLTPFTAAGAVDYAALERMVNYVVEDCEATMVIAAGVEAQEYQYLSFSERKDLIRSTIELVDGRRPVAVGISHPSARVVLELADFAQQQGASALQLLAPMKPTGGQPKLSELVSYYETVLRRTTLPVMLYLNPGPGAEVSVKDTVELAKLEGIAFVKESSRDLTRVSRLIEEIEHGGHAHYFTTLQMNLASLMLGGTGVTLPPPAALISRKIHKAFVAGDWVEAARLQRQFALFPARWMEFGLAAVMKAALNLQGMALGDPYPPYEPLSEPALKSLQAYLNTMDL